jgi:hypothetical protein
MRFQIAAIVVCAIIGPTIARASDAPWTIEAAETDFVSARVADFDSRATGRHYTAGTATVVVGDGKNHLDLFLQPGEHRASPPADGGQRLSAASASSRSHPGRHSLIGGPLDSET